jgi:hypothetical protein
MVRLILESFWVMKCVVTLASGIDVAPDVYMEVSHVSVHDVTPL